MCQMSIQLSKIPPVRGVGSLGKNGVTTQTKKTFQTQPVNFAEGLRVFANAPDDTQKRICRWQVFANPLARPSQTFKKSPQSSQRPAKNKFWLKQLNGGFSMVFLASATGTKLKTRNCFSLSWNVMSCTRKKLHRRKKESSNHALHHSLENVKSWPPVGSPELLLFSIHETYLSP